MNEIESLLMGQAGKAWGQIRAAQPLVYHITNYVTMPEQAHATLAIGASPVMAPSPEEAAEMCSAADALLLNIGTPTAGTTRAMLEALAVAKRRKLPVVLDVVGAGATSYRNRLINSLLEQNVVSVLKGNYGEIMALVGAVGTVRGVDSTCERPRDLKAIVHQLGQRYQLTVIATGEVDYLGQETAVHEVHGGSALLTHMTGSGCILGSLLAASCAAAGTSLPACIAALVAMKMASEQAGHGKPGVGTFRMRIFDALFALTAEDLITTRGHLQAEKSATRQAH